MKIALVHDWLTGMRGGEKCLEVLCRRFPDAEIHTLLHRPGRDESNHRANGDPDEFPSASAGEPSSTIGICYP